ncbi:hypothetical protein Nepgr_032394 [Nepenthes gracilis]|uniref:Apyrase 7 n=1 Tax=Nepenthes gracilis TaxID=150966 RepID=A0AAD3TJY5_NEPGR|nr:hypothetical protein Nepgr_032394 [Nepenthes gracilis]
MVFSRVAEIIFAVTNRPSVRKTSSIPYMSSGLSPPTGYGHGFSISSPGKKSTLRLSSSLQDLSAYRRLDLEDIDHNSGIGTIHAKQPHPFQRENGNSSFSKEKASQGTSFVQKKVTRVLMILLCLILFAILVFMLVHFYWFGGVSKFYVVLDCGSTGTRVNIYQVSLNHKKNGNLPIVLISYSEGFRRKPKGQSGRAYNRMETEPGLDKLVHNVTGLKAAIRPLLHWAEKQIPKHSHKTTSLFLYATAGVRRLPSSDSEWLLNHVWSLLHNSSFLCQRDWIKIISGIEEAYYGWIALNYQEGVLGTMPEKATFGALDLGGSSLQVTFETKKLVPRESNLNFNIGPVNHHLSAYSLSSYGLNDAFDKSVVHLLKRLSKVSNGELVHGKVEILHPCLQSGYRQQYICSQCASVSQEAGSPLHELENLGKRVKAGIPVWLVGAPNWTECSALAKIAVNLSEWSDQSPGIDCDVHPCALSDDLPHPYGHFYAMSGFFVVYRFFNLASEATLDDVLDKGRDFCDKTWEVAYKSVPSQPYIEQYCFRAPYIVSLLREGLHITDNQVTIGSGSITWTLGVALVEAGKAFSSRIELQSYELFQMKINPIILVVIILISTILFVYALSCLGNWLPRFFCRPQLPLFRHNSTSTTSVLNLPFPFWFQGWSPSSDWRGKTPLSPTTAGEQERPFGTGYRLSGGSIQLSDSSLYPETSSVSHSFPSGSLGQIQFDNGGMGSFRTPGMGSFRTPHRSQMHLQSRRSQSREDLNSSIAEAHMVKV